MQESFRDSLKAMLETRLLNRQITGVNIEIFHNGGNLVIRATGNAVSIGEAQHALRDYCSLIDYVISD